jgi:hypothetical protein
MPCHVVSLPGGGHAIVRTSGQFRRRKCSVCERMTERGWLCDGSIGQGKTCDAFLCADCTTRGPNDTDYCPLHVRQIPGKD